MPEQTILDIGGMTCAACVRRVEKALLNSEGVETVVVNFATHRALITHLGSSSHKLIETVERAGYEAHVHQDDAELAVDTEQLRKQTRRVFLSIGLTLPVASLSMAPVHLGVPIHLLLAVLTTVVVFGCGAPIFQRALKAAQTRTATMDTLVSVGVLASWISSVWFMASQPSHTWGHNLYFETSAVIVSLILLGRWLESRAKQKMSASIGSLLALHPKTANRLDENDQITLVKVSELKVGNRVLIKPGEQFPADGVIVDGSSFANESMLTGEPLPVEKSVGDTVVGGSLNEQGSLIVRVTTVGSDSTLARIAKLVDQAQGSRAPLQNLADRVSAIFVPVVIVLAVVTVLYHGVLGAGWSIGLRAGVSVLVAACPCALGLATPTALVVAIGAAAQKGILIKDGEALQRGAEISKIYFDKTGTLTEGKPSVTHFFSDGPRKDEAFKALASAEKLSEHPLSKAILSYPSFDGETFVVSDFQAEQGKGFTAIVDGQLARVGRPEFVDLHLVSSIAKLDELATTGASLVALRWGETEALVAISDQPRAEAGALVSDLHAQGIRAAMLTGDNPGAAAVVANEVGIQEVHAGLLPEDKIRIVQANQTKVGMVGDGINDAPALAAADLSIAMGMGTDAAIHSAGITLLRNDLRAIPQAVKLCRATLRVIKQNLGWAFGYNLLILPLAAAGRLSPMIASAAMALSSVSVISNALRLRSLKL